MAALAAGTVLAHALMLRSDPPDLCQAAFVSESVCATGSLLEAPPAVVRIWFSEPVQPFAGGITVRGPSGSLAERGAVNVGHADLSIAVVAGEPGTYVVHWRVIAADTHPARGTFAFSVGRTSAVPASQESDGLSVGAVSPLGLVLQVAGRWLHFAGFALSFGVLAFRVLVLDAARGSPLERRLARLISIGLLLLLAAEPLALLGQTGSLGAGAMLEPAVVGGALDSSFGRALALRLGAAASLWVLLGIEGDGAPWAAAVALAAGWVLALLDGASAHAASLQPVWLGLTVNALHLSAAGAWLGGLASLIACWRLPEAAAMRRTLIKRFGRLAVAALLLVVLSGGLMAWAHQALPVVGLPGIYSLLVLAKIALLLPVMLAAAFALRGLSARPERWWLGEAAVLACALVLAGLLVSLPPPA
jgi:copper transport protein